MLANQFTGGLVASVFLLNDTRWAADRELGR